MSRFRRPSASPAPRWLRALVSLALVASVAAPVAGQELRRVMLDELTGAPAGKQGGSAPHRNLVVQRAGNPGEVPMAQGFVAEVEPNGTSATATPLTGTNVVGQGTNIPASDVDFWSFSAAAGDRVYAAVMTSASPGSVNSILDVIASDGTTVLETDLDDGTFGATSSSIAGTLIPSPGTYYLRVRENTTATIRPYHLHFQLQSGAPVPETEPNDAAPQPLPASGWVSGSTSAVSDVDRYSINLNAGDTIYLSLDLDPERDAVEWNGVIGLGPFAGIILTISDAGAQSPDSEAFFMTVQDTGTYQVFVAATGTFGTYHLSVSVNPPVDEGLNCTVYTSTDVPVAIPTGPGQVNSTLTVPGNPRIADMDVTLQFDHTFVPDLDFHLVSPAGNDNGLVSDIGAGVVANALVDITLDDEAGIPPVSPGTVTILNNETFQPELAYRLNWFDGESAGGVWTLAIRDDAAGDGGNLTGWSLRICEPAPAPVCGPGTIPTTVYQSDFEADDGGFTHSGALDEWERGLPTFVPITTCNSGTNCWKTDLDNTYDALSNQNLLSPNIDLSGLTPPVVVTWSHRFHVESATFDHFNVTAREVGNPTNAVNLFEFIDATMNDVVGNPTVTIAESAGWGRYTRTIDSFAGLNTELNFHLDSDNTVQLTGAAIDDVSVTACMPGVPEITLSKTVGLTSGVCGTDETLTIEHGTPVTYCYTVENTGDITLTTHDLVDDQLGTILDNEPITLDPGDTAEVIVSDVLLDATTTNNATWDASATTTSEACGAGIAIVGASGAPYPSTAALAGAGAAPSRVSVTLDDVNHTFASDMDFLLVGPGGQTLIVASDFSAGDELINVDLLLDDNGPATLPADDPVASGTYRPTDHVLKIDDWPPPAPAPPYGDPEPTGTDTFTSEFGGLDPNGTWSLYATDAFPAADDGSIAGWCISAVYEGSSASASDSVTVTVLFPDIAVDPASLESFQAVDTQVTLPLDITNNGTATLDWTITEGESRPDARPIVRLPGRQEPIRTSRRNPAPEPGRMTQGSENFSRAQSDEPARRVAPERGEVPDGSVTITHSTTQNIVSLNSVSCNAGGLHTDNSYIRRFDLGAFGISGAFDITEVSFGIETALGAGGSQPLDVNLYTWDPSDPFVFASFSPIGSVSASIPDQSLTIVTVPIAATAPAGSTLVVEIFTPEGQTAGHSLFVGSNPDGQTDPTFLAAAACGVPEPTDTAVIGFPGMHFVLNVTGESGCDADLTWVSADPTSGATAPATTDTVDVTFDSTGLEPSVILTGSLCIESDDPDTPTVLVPLTLETDSMPFLDDFETGDTSRWSFVLP